MKNDYKPDGSAYVPYLADIGAREADYDEQGAVKFKSEPSQKSEYERLKSVLFDMGRRIPEGGSIWVWLENEGFGDLVNAFQEGEKVRDPAPGYVWFKDNRAVTDEEAAADPTLNDAARQIMAKIMKDNQPTNDWIDHDGGDKPEWLGDYTRVYATSSNTPKNIRYKAFSATEIGWSTVKKYRPVGSTVVGGWRKHDGREPDIDADAIIETVMRCGASEKCKASQVRWDVWNTSGDIIWYRVISS